MLKLSSRVLVLFEKKKQTRTCWLFPARSFPKFRAFEARVSNLGSPWLISSAQTTRPPFPFVQHLSDNDWSTSVLLFVPVHREHLQRPGADGSLGLLRRVQPHLGGGAVRGGRAGEVDPGRHQGQEGPLHLPGRGDQYGTDRRALHHHEPRLCRPDRAAREPQGSVPVSR